MLARIVCFLTLIPYVAMIIMTPVVSTCGTLAAVHMLLQYRWCGTHDQVHMLARIVCFLTLIPCVAMIIMTPVRWVRYKHCSTFAVVQVVLYK
jgi:hypothetical protein